MQKEEKYAISPIFIDIEYMANKHLEKDNSIFFQSQETKPLRERNI